MQSNHFKRVDALVKRSPLVIAGIYFFFSIIWIIYSDSWVVRYYDDPQIITNIQTYKGWFFVSLSSIVIYFLILSSNKTISKFFKNKLQIENIFEATFEQAAVGLSHHDENYNWLRINDRLCEMLQYTKPEFEHLSLEQFVHPDDLEKGKELDKKLLKGELQSYQVEKRYRRKDGTLIYVLLSKALARDLDQKPMFFVSVMEDITYLKEIENNLKRAYQLAEIGSWKYDLNTNKIEWSKEVRKLHEVGNEFEPTLDNVDEFYQKEPDASKVRDAFDRCIKKGENFDIEVQIITAKGNERWIRLMGEAAMIKGECISIFGSSQNIDQRKKAEIRYQELYQREKSERLNTEKLNQRLKFLDTIGGMFVISDPELNHIFDNISKLLVKNLADICCIDLIIKDKFERVSQEVHSLDTKKVLDTINEEYPYHFSKLNLFNEVLETGKPKIIRNISEEEYKKFFKDDVQVDIYKKLQIHSFMIIPIIIKEKVSGIISLELTKESGRVFNKEDDLFMAELANKMALFIENLRMRDDLKSFNKKLEQLVEERTNQLELINQELESFSYSVSHDLRSPLRAISGYTSLLIEEHANQLKSEGIEFLEIIESEVKRMGQLIDDLLSFSRLSRTGMSFVDFNMDELVHKCIEEISRQNSLHDVQFEIQIKDDVNGDPSLLKQVWINLISNAVKYRKESESPEIIIKSEIDAKKQRITYSIKDNGVGFDMKYSDKLFGVFQRLHSDDQFEGTGIGLALVKRIIIRHNGEVWAESEPGSGSIFYFSIPLY